MLCMFCSVLLTLSSCKPRRCGGPWASLLRTNLLQKLRRDLLLWPLAAYLLSILHIPPHCLIHVRLMIYATRMALHSRPVSTPPFRIPPSPLSCHVPVDSPRPTCSVRRGRSVWVGVFSGFFSPFSSSDLARSDVKSELFSELYRH